MKNKENVDWLDENDKAVNKELYHNKYTQKARIDLNQI